MAITCTAKSETFSALQCSGFLSSGTYGRVYKARVRRPTPALGPGGVGGGGPGTPLHAFTSGAGGGGGGNTGGYGFMGTPNALTPGKRLKLTREDGQGANGNGGELEGELVAIKKFKPDKEGEVVQYTGISQSACREIMINRELSHEHVTALREVMLEEKSIYLVFEYAEHDFLQIIHHHSSTRTVLPVAVLKSLLWQLFNGVSYLHDNWVIHRDLKPANILVNGHGQVKIGDLGLARLYQEPLQPLYTSDKIVVTVWYRSPELLLGARHYTPAIDLWSMGCIYGELLGLRPMFKGEEAKVEVGGANGGGGGQKKSGVPFQRDQMSRVIEVLGSVDRAQWPSVTQMPEFPQLTRMDRHPDTLEQWYASRCRSMQSQSQSQGGQGAQQDIHAAQAGYNLLRQLLAYDPARRITARAALTHSWWASEPRPHANAFTGLPPGANYPLRRVSHDEDPKLSSAAPARPYGAGSTGGGGAFGNSATATGGAATGAGGRASKRSKLDR